MKRDMDLVRQILLALESGEPPNSQIEIEGWTAEQIGYHCYLMADAGLIEAADIRCMADTYPNMMPLHMTWAGQDFLAAARKDTVWAKAKTVVLGKAGDAAFSVLLAYLKQQATEALGLPP